MFPVAPLIVTFIVTFIVLLFLFFLLIDVAHAVVANLSSVGACHQQIARAVWGTTASCVAGAWEGGATPPLTKQNNFQQENAVVLWIIWIPKQKCYVAWTMA